MRSEPLVSVIVPVYNTEIYLECCIESLLNQTLQEIEIVIVDDASTDNSKDIIRKYELQDKRIKAIYLEKNGGLSFARNTGIATAQGKFIGFLDSDDYVSEDMYQRMVTAANEFNTEVVMCGYHKCDESGEILSSYRAALPSNRYFDKDELLQLTSKAHKSQFIWYVWRNIYKRDLLINNNIFFDENVKFAEDSVFNLYAFNLAKGAVAINEPLYYYRTNPNSLTSSKEKPALEENLTKQYQEKLKFYNQFGIYEQSAEDLSNYVATHQLMMLIENASLAEHSIKRIKSVLSLEMISHSLSHTSILKKQSSIGAQIVIILSKLKQARLLKLYLARN